LILWRQAARNTEAFSPGTKFAVLCSGPAGALWVPPICRLHEFSDEQAMGAAYAASIDQNVTIDTDGPTNDDLLMFRQLFFAKAELDRSDIIYRIKIVDDDRINAFLYLAAIYTFTVDCTTS